MQRAELLETLNAWLKPNLIKDFSPNGLQVEGGNEIAKVVTGVTASQALIDKAISAQADAILVHHGYFWKNEAQPIVGMKKRRIAALLEANINLIGYHLPLDVHPEFGNNVQLLKRLEAVEIEPVAEIKPEGLLMKGRLAQKVSGSQFARDIEALVQRKLVASVQSEKLIETVAVCTGGGQSFIEQAVECGVDAFITGEVSEQTIHVARECGIQFFAAGHHATERFGVFALGEKIKNELGLSVQFIDVDSPA
ncbi:MULTISPECIES: Nif3-like dinuclear metal center hexameric protein [Gammaproteobacteria]|uniref:Nif3-like dinuclear metal center hexameric protein n=1 Tax=Gammaproteobacteria TaxID=1236 RepID=UPI000DD0660F|nr:MULTISPECIES: Nif3-like dinuclear metal center hexameric protein [Gammaproteobacteria]RTE87314.1 Nif3-like dinuclear metal center hexameric protein [Aliidiomarina sp. B3213]TCZ92900.1 Nif3-like dinuclear metal center hexameric protein [Lysobacter sp. N42]